MNNLVLNQTNSFVISDWLSPDEKYCIFLDELYDIKNKKKLGDVWENFENFKFFIRYSTSVSNLSNTIKESIYDSLNSTVLTENLQSLLNKNKSNLKKLISEGVFSDFTDWVKETGKSSVEGFKEFAKTSYDGLGDLVDTISNSDFKKAFDIINKGIFYFAKSLRDALYSPAGLILDAILVASGIGKSVQWIPWSIIVALDLYELFSGKYDGGLIQHLLSTLFDVVGLVTTGAIAKGLKIGFKGVTKVDDIVKVVNKNPQIKNIFKQIPEILSKVSPKLQKAVKYLSDKFPKGAKLINSILGKVDEFITMMTKEFGKLFKTKVGVSGLSAAGLTFGFEQLFGGGEFEMTDEAAEIFANSEIDLEGSLSSRSL